MMSVAYAAMRCLPHTSVRDAWLKHYGTTLLHDAIKSSGVRVCHAAGGHVMFRIETASSMA